MKEIFTPSKTDLFVAAAPVAYEHSRAARVALRMFFFLPMSIVAGIILPMFVIDIDNWSLLRFLPFMIGVPVLTFFILGEHPEDRAIREANQARQIQQNAPKPVKQVNNYNDFSLEDALENHVHAFDNLNHLKQTPQNSNKKKKKRNQNQNQNQKQGQQQNQQKKNNRNR